MRHHQHSLAFGGEIRKQLHYRIGCSGIEIPSRLICDDQLLLSGFEPLRAQFEDFLSGTTFDIEGPWALSLTMFQEVQKQKGGYITLTHVQKFLYGYLLEHLKSALPKRNKNIPPELLAH